MSFVFGPSVKYALRWSEELMCCPVHSENVCVRHARSKGRVEGRTQLISNVVLDTTNCLRETLCTGLQGVPESDFAGCLQWLPICHSWNSWSLLSLQACPRSPIFTVVRSNSDCVNKKLLRESHHSSINDHSASASGSAAHADCYCTMCCPCTHGHKMYWSSISVIPDGYSELLQLLQTQQCPWLYCRVTLLKQRTALVWYR